VRGRFLVSLPERVVRSLAAVLGGAVHETAQVVLPRLVRRSRLYEATAKNLLRITIELVGGVIVGNAFDLGLYRKGAGKTEKFDAVGIVNVYCNVHSNMSAVIHIMSAPYYGFADANGHYAFDVPPGRYRLVAWNEQGGMSATVIDVGAAGTAMAGLTIDSRNFRAGSHMNKLGRAYQPGTREY